MSRNLSVVQSPRPIMTLSMGQSYFVVLCLASVNGISVQNAKSSERATRSEETCFPMQDYFVPERESWGDVYEIRYATAKRFQHSVMMDDPTIKTDAKPRPISKTECMQHGENYFENEHGHNTAWGGNEDCLWTLVVTPSNAQAGSKLPVSIYTHGGSGEVGSRYPGSFFKEIALKGIISISYQYRLGLFGSYPRPEFNGDFNWALGDQQLLMKWVQRYICGFGGDPNSVTLVGSSAGAMFNQIHLASPKFKGLFHRAWVFGSSVGARFYSKDAEAAYRHNLACSSLTVEKMKHMAAKSLLHVWRQNCPPQIAFGYDGVWAVDTARAICDGSLVNGNIPIVTGTAKDEWAHQEADFAEFTRYTLFEQMENVSYPMTTQKINEQTQICMFTRFQNLYNYNFDGHSYDLNTSWAHYAFNDLLSNMLLYKLATRHVSDNLALTKRWRFMSTHTSSIRDLAEHIVAEKAMYMSDPSVPDKSWHDPTEKFKNYVHENFVSFIKTGEMKDSNWVQTVPVLGASGYESSSFGGVPVKEFSDDPYNSPVNLQKSYFPNKYALEAIFEIQCKNTIPNKQYFLECMSGTTEVGNPYLDPLFLAESPVLFRTAQ